LLNGQIVFDGGGKKQLPEDCPNGLEYQPSSSRAISPSPSSRSSTEYFSQNIHHFRKNVCYWVLFCIFYFCAGQTGKVELHYWACQSNFRTAKVQMVDEGKLEEANFIAQKEEGILFFSSDKL